MRRLNLVQISGNNAGPGGAPHSTSRKLVEWGFQDKDDVTNLGTQPLEDKVFVVEYEEGAAFRLIRVEDDGTETVLDEGSAGESHHHGGLGTTTFYGKGEVIASLSFHCQPEV